MATVKNYGLLLAPTGEWEVIDTFYSPGIMDRATEDGRSFTLIVAPAEEVDHNLFIKGLTDYSGARKSRNALQKRRAIETYWGIVDRPVHTNITFWEYFSREDTSWEERPEYRVTKYPYNQSVKRLFSIEVD